MQLDLSTIRKFAPIVKLHPEEKYHPMDPMEFIRKSRFRHHRSGAKDQGYNKKTRKWVTTNSRADSYYDVPVSYVDGFDVWRNDENRRPRDSNNGNDWNVFLQPKGKPRGRRDPNGAVPVFYAIRYVDTAKLSKKIRAKFGIKIERYHKVQYWWFNGYNDGPVTGGLDAHQGDWEHITLKLVNERPKRLYYAAHGQPAVLKPSQVKWSGAHPVVYCAVGSHASYHRVGRFKLVVHSIKDETKDGGRVWSTEDYLLNVRSQPWRNFAGAWGEVGEFAHSTGPLGPWYKRRKN
jgi:hypothetical protein